MSAATLARIRHTIAAGTCTSCGYVTALQDDTRRTRATRCGGCGFRVTLDYVTGEHNGAMPCDDRCQYAAREFCSCSCGGRNHRAGYIQPPERIPVWVRERDAKRHTDKRTRATEKRERVRRDREQEARDGRAALLAEHPELSALDTDPRYADSASRFVENMRAALAAGYMSPGQINATVKMITRDRERDADRAAEETRRVATVAAGVAVPVGRVTFSGTITRVVLREGTGYGWQSRDQYRMCVRHADGWEVWGTVPGDLSAAVMRDPLYREACDRDISPRPRILEGHTVTLTAELTAGTRSPISGGYSRPTGAVLDPVTVDATVTACPVRAPRKPRPAPVAVVEPADAWGDIDLSDPWGAILTP